MTLITAANIAQARLETTVTASIIGSTDGNTVLLKAMLDKAAQDIRDEYPWPQLRKEHTFTLATSTASYALPGDLHRLTFETMWNRSQHWPLIGPLDPVEWQQYKSGIIASYPRQRFMVRGWTGTQFYIDPTPDSGLNGQTMVFEYTSSYTMRPATVWSAGLNVAGIRYIYYGMNIYDRGGIGAATTGATPPTHTSGAVSDGLVTWTYMPNYDTALNDTDVYLIDEQDVIDGAVWRFKRQRNLPYEELQAEAQAGLDSRKTELQAASVLTVNGYRLASPMIGPWSYPVQNF